MAPPLPSGMLTSTKAMHGCHSGCRGHVCPGVLGPSWLLPNPQQHPGTLASSWGMHLNLWQLRVHAVCKRGCILAALIGLTIIIHHCAAPAMHRPQQASSPISTPSDPLRPPSA